MIRLEKFTNNDTEKLISWVISPEYLLQFAGPKYTFPLTREQINTDLNDQHRMMFKVLNNEGTTIGHAQIYIKAESLLLGRILIGEAHFRNKGVGKEIISQLLDFGFQQYDKSIAELNVFDWNLSAIHCYKKIGFEIDKGIFSTSTINGEQWKAINMKISKSQFDLYKNNLK